jgi:PEP-CTERM motif-containing protein
MTRFAIIDNLLTAFSGATSTKFKLRENIKKNSPIAYAGAIILPVVTALTVAQAPAAKAAIIAVDDSGSWITGTNTIANQGYDLVTVPNGSEPEFSIISTLSSSLGDLTFSPEVDKRFVGSNWATWSNGYTGEVYFSQGSSSLTITLPSAISAFDFYAEPNLFDTFEIVATAQNGVSTTLSQLVNGDSGAKYFGFYATDGDLISSITITDPSGNADGFAVGQLRLATSVPEPATMLGLLTVASFGVTLRRQQKQQQKATSKA